VAENAVETQDVGVQIGEKIQDIGKRKEKPPRIGRGAKQSTERIDADTLRFLPAYHGPRSTHYAELRIDVRPCVS